MFPPLISLGNEMMIRALLVIISIFSLFITSYSLEIVYPPSLAGVVFDTPRHLRIGPTSWNPVTCILIHQHSNRTDWATNVTTSLDGRLTSVDQLCYILSYTYFVNGITISSMDGSIAQNLQTKNQTAAVILPAYASGQIGSNSLARDWSVTPEDQEFLTRVDRPVAECTFESSEALLQLVANNSIIVVKIYDSDYTSYKFVYNSIGGLAVAGLIIGVPALINLIICARQLLYFVRDVGCCRMSLPIWCLTLEFVANFIRVVNGIEVPMYWRGIMYFQPHFVVSILSDPLTVMTTLLISLYWNELTTQTSAKPISFLIRYRTLFFVVATSLMVVTFILACLISSVGATVLYPLIAIAALCVGVVVPFFWANGIRILRQLRKSPPNAKSRHLQRTTKKLLLSGIFLLGWLPCIILFSMLPAVEGFIVNIYVYTCLNATSLLQITCFNPPNQVKGTSGTNLTNRSPAPTHNSDESVK